MSRPIKTVLAFSFAAGMLLLSKPFFAKPVLLGCLLLTAALVLVLLLGGLAGLVTGRLPGWLPRGARLGASLLAAILLLCGPVIGWVKYNEIRARAYVEKAAKFMDDTRKRTGRFPVVLGKDFSGSRREFDRLHGRFFTDGEVYRFEYRSPLVISGGAEFRSEDRRWRTFDELE